MRDRESYACAVASAAVALAVDGGHLRQAHIALGGVATRPWHAREAEVLLNNRTIDREIALAACRAAFGDA
jgi:xanthine dehydrogenase YagS FAD-binding subunit